MAALQAGQTGTQVFVENVCLTDRRHEAVKPKVRLPPDQRDAKARQQVRANPCEKVFVNVFSFCFFAFLHLLLSEVLRLRSPALFLQVKWQMAPFHRCAVCLH